MLLPKKAPHDAAQQALTRTFVQDHHPKPYTLLFPNFSYYQSANTIVDGKLDLIAGFKTIKQRFVFDVKFHRHRGHQIPYFLVIDFN